MMRGKNTMKRKNVDVIARIVACFLCVVLFTSGINIPVYATEEGADVVEEMSLPDETILDETILDESETELIEEEPVSNDLLNTASNDVMPVAEVVIGNGGYPYGSLMGSSSVTLGVKLDSGTAASYQWMYATAKDGEYTAISGATSDTYRFTPTNGYWYKCQINGTQETLPIQAVKAGTDSTTFLRPYTSGQWYLGNGYMAYMVNGASFDMVGKYTRDGSRYYWMNTSYSSGWKCYTSTSANPSSTSYGYATSAAMDGLYCSFDPYDDRTILVEADLASGQQAFSFGADVMLADYTLTSYSDSASLKAIQGLDGNLSQIQMVGAATVDDAVEEDPAFVMKVVDVPSAFWIGGYSSRCAYGYNTASSASGGIKEVTVYNGQSVVSEVAGLDSGMMASWMNVPSGGSIRFQFSVGSVSETGAQITANTTVTSKTITITDADPNYYYALYTDDGTKVCDWINSTSGEIIFENLKPDTAYVVQIVHKDDFEEGNDDENTSNSEKVDASTAIDPILPTPGEDSGEGETEAVVPVITPGVTNISIINLNPEYTYQLKDENGRAVSGFVAPTDGAVNFTGLTADTPYYLVAKSATNVLSDQVEIYTLHCEDEGAGGHVYGAPTFTWGANNASCVATFTCSNNRTHTYQENCTLSYEATQEPDCVTNGVGTTTATVEMNGNTYTDYVNGVIGAIGHDYRLDKYVWEDDYSDCYAYFVCQNDNTHVEYVDGDLSWEQTREATCQVTALIEYTAVFPFEGEEYITTKVQELETVDHVYEQYVYNNDATYFADGTKTAQCVFGCGETDTVTAENTMLIDATLPNAVIDISEKTWDGFFSEIFGNIFYNNPQEVTISYEDNESGLDQQLYYVSEEYISESDIVNVTEWETYEGPFTIDPDNEYVVYAKVTDLCGNVGYYSTEGLVLDATAPAIAGIVNGESYCETVTFTVNDNYISKITLDGVELSVLENEFTLAYDLQEHTIIATDKAGNETKVVIRFVEHDYNSVVTEPTSLDKGYTTYTCTECNDSYVDNWTEALGVVGESSNDEEGLEDLIQEAEDRLQNPDLSDEEREKLQETIDDANEILDKIEETKEDINDVKEDVAEIPQTENVNEDDLDEIESAIEEIDRILEENADYLTELQKESLEAQKAALEEKIDIIEEVQNAVDTATEETEAIPSINEVTAENKETIEEQLAEIEQILTDYASNLTEEQKEALEAQKAALEEKIDIIEEVQNAVDNVENGAEDIPAKEEVTFRDKVEINESLEEIESVLNDYSNNLTEDQKEDLEELQESLEEKLDYASMPADIINDTKPENNNFEGDLPEAADVLTDKVLEVEDVERASVGEPIRIFLEVTDITETVTENDETLVEDAVENSEVGAYLDISLFKQIGDDAPEKITNTNGTVTIAFTLPEELINTNSSVNRTYQIVRVHEGAATVIECEIDWETLVVTFETDAFSTYAIVYTDTQKATTNTNTNNASGTGEPVKDSVPKTSGSNLFLFWTAFMLLSGMATMVFAEKIMLKKGKESET